MSKSAFAAGERRMHYAYCIFILKSFNAITKLVFKVLLKMIHFGKHKQGSTYSRIKSLDF